MRLSSSAATMLLMDVALCIIRGISDANIQRIREDYEMQCLVCHGRLVEIPEQKKVVYLVACQHLDQHIFHAECLAREITQMVGGKMACPADSEDCRAMVRRVLVDCRNNDENAAEFFRWKVLEHMNKLSEGAIWEIFDHVGVIPSDYECLAKNLAGLQLDRVSKVVANRISTSIYNAADPYECLISKNIDYISINTYIMLFIKCFTNGISGSQTMAILERLMQRKYRSETEKDRIVTSFVCAVLSSPNIRLLNGDGYALLLRLLKAKMASPVIHMLSETGMVYAMSTGQVVEVLKCCLDMGFACGYPIFKSMWVYGIHMRNLGSEAVQQIKLQIDEHLVALNIAENDTTRESLNEMCSVIPPKVLNIKKTINAIERLSTERDQMNARGIVDGTEYLIKNGIVHAILHANHEKRMQIFQNMFIRLDSNFFRMAYLNFPESMVSVEIDLAFLKSFVSSPTRNYVEIVKCIQTFAKRQYFGYEMLMRTLGILLGSATNFEEPFYIWLLFIVNPRSFLEGLSGDEYSALSQRLIRAKLFNCCAFLEKPSGGNAEHRRIIIKNVGCIVQLFPRISRFFRMHVACQYTDTYIFTIWSKCAVRLVRRLLERRDRIMDINFFILSICGSKHFANTVSGIEVAEIIALLLECGDAAYRYIDAFLMVARSGRHVHAAKMELFKALIAQQLTDEDVAAMNEMGFRFKRTGSELAYVMEDGSTRKLVPEKLGEPVVEMIEAADRHCLLRLLRDKNE